MRARYRVLQFGFVDGLPKGKALKHFLSVCSFLTERPTGKLLILMNMKPSGGDDSGIDRISSLPDSLLSHTLSFLPMKDAVRTSLLASRWKFLYASIPTLHFDDEPFYRDDNFAFARKCFVDFVERVLLLRAGARIDELRLNFDFGDPYDTGCVSSWISDALRHHVCKLELCACISRPLTNFPSDLFSSTTLAVLKLTSVKDLKVPCSVCFPSLKVLHLNLVKFCGDGSASRLISACHVLEELSVSFCLFKSEHGILTLSISTLKMLSARWLHDAKLVLDTPNLDHLCINVVSRGCTWKDNVKSLAMAHIEIALNDPSLRQHSGDIFAPISELKHLRLSGCSKRDLEVEYFSLPSSFKLTHLELIATAFGKSNALIILNWLGYFAKIKVLTLTMGYDVSTENGFPDTSPTCLSLELLEVNILSFDGQESELSILEYLLITARVLKKMTIKFCISSPEERLHATTKVLSLPRLSQGCVITVK